MSLLISKGASIGSRTKVSYLYSHICIIVDDKFYSDDYNDNAIVMMMTMMVVMMMTMAIVMMMTMAIVMMMTMSIVMMISILLNY